MNIIRIKKLNEELDKILNESLREYKLTIIVNRNRDSIGKVLKTTLSAKNDVDAFYKVLAEYNTCCQGYFDGGMEAEDLLQDKEKEMLYKIKSARETNKNQEEAIKLMSEIYHNTMDISDYFDDIIMLEGPSGIVFKDEHLDITDWKEE